MKKLLLITLPFLSTYAFADITGCFHRSLSKGKTELICHAELKQSAIKGGLVKILDAKGRDVAYGQILNVHKSNIGHLYQSKIKIKKLNAGEKIDSTHRVQVQKSEADGKTSLNWTAAF